MIYLLDAEGKRLPTRKRTRREQAKKRVKGRDLLHYEIYVHRKIGIKPDGSPILKYCRRREWLPDMAAAEALEREFRNEAPAEAFTWFNAYEYFIEKKREKHSESHRKGLKYTIEAWNECHGVESTIEETTLEMFCAWLEYRAINNSPRRAQLDFSHLMAIARYCLARGKVTVLPFAHAPKPEANMGMREAVPPHEYFTRCKMLPEKLRYCWQLLGVTGMRISAACGLREEDIDTAGGRYVVTTKGNKRVYYPLTAEVQRIFDAQRAWKADREKPFRTPHMFCTTRGAAWNAASFGSALRKAQKGMGMVQYTAHQLRHMMATACAKANMSPEMIAAALHHEDLESSKKYIHKDLDMTRQALEVGVQFLSNYGTDKGNVINNRQSRTNTDDHRQAWEGKTGSDTKRQKNTRKKGVA